MKFIFFFFKIIINILYILINYNFNFRFIELENQIKELNIDNSLKNIILEKYQQCWEKMYNPAIIISYYLDLRYHGQALKEEYSFTVIANEISKYVNQDSSGQLAEELLNYNIKTGPFSLSMF